MLSLYSKCESMTSFCLSLATSKIFYFLTKYRNVLVGKRSFDCIHSFVLLNTLFELLNSLQPTCFSGLRMNHPKKHLP